LQEVIVRRRKRRRDNGRGTAEQHIKEGKNPLRWTRLSQQEIRWVVGKAVKLAPHCLRCVGACLMHRTGANSSVGDRHLGHIG
jgi:hypothetical protein